MLETDKHFEAFMLQENPKVNLSRNEITGTYKIAAVRTAFKYWTKGRATGVSETIHDYEEVLADKHRLTKAIDVLMNGDKAAKQASLVDLLPQIQELVARQIPWRSIKDQPPRRGQWILWYDPTRKNNQDKNFEFDDFGVTRYTPSDWYADSHYVLISQLRQNFRSQNAKAK